MRKRFPLLLAVALALLVPAPARAACCFFAPRSDRQKIDISQPAQKVFITWDSVRKIETFTVQPKFEGSAFDFGMVIPTPSRPKLDEMPRDFFKHLAVYSLLKNREFPQSKLLQRPPIGHGVFGGGGRAKGGDQNQKDPGVKVLEVGVVGSHNFC